MPSMEFESHREYLIFFIKKIAPACIRAVQEALILRPRPSPLARAPAPAPAY